MRDFTINTFKRLLTTLKNQDYSFQTFSDFLKNPAEKSIILRHDVDARKMNSLLTAQIENEMGISGTYYFRMVPASYDEGIIKQIYDLGHEIGYHYEDLSMCAARSWGRRAGGRLKTLTEVRASVSVSALTEERASVAQSIGPEDNDSNRTKGQRTKRPLDTVLPDEKLFKAAIISFRENLTKLRRVVPVETICMHGSPLSRWDNRLLWKYYDYRDFGIIGEPYFDLDFNEVLYLTDTGRRWDGDSVNIRDMAEGRRRKAEGKDMTKRLRPKALTDEGASVDLGTKSEDQPVTSNKQPATLPKLHSTFDLIEAARNDKLSNKIMITVHPQRWTNKSVLWTWELIWQNLKNAGKMLIVSVYS